MKLIRIVFFCSFVALLGCESDSDSQDQSSLAGTSWRLSSWSVSSINPLDYEITANFDADTIGGRAAVNTYGGEYTPSSSGSLIITGLVSTLIAGSPPAMEAESKYFEALGNVRKYRVDADSLVMMDGDSRDLLTFNPR
jgi:heat shock protein HslJ